MVPLAACPLKEDANEKVCPPGKPGFILKRLAQPNTPAQREVLLKLKADELAKELPPEKGQ